MFDHSNFLIHFGACKNSNFNDDLVIKFYRCHEGWSKGVVIVGGHLMFRFWDHLFGSLVSKLVMVNFSDRLDHFLILRGGAMLWLLWAGRLRTLLTLDKLDLGSRRVFWSRVRNFINVNICSCVHESMQWQPVYHDTLCILSPFVRELELWRLLTPLVPRKS